MPSVRTYVGWLAFEHVGVPNYGRFFQKIRELLSADGVALIYSIGRINGPGHHECARKYIFPGGHTACHRARGPVSHPLEILRLHYAEPLRHWRERFLACRATVRKAAFTMSDFAACGNFTSPLANAGSAMAT